MKMFKQRDDGPRKRSITPDAEVPQRAKEYDPLIIVKKKFDEKYVPNGYTMLTLNTPVDSFTALVRAETMFYLDQRNLGNGNNVDLEGGLDALTELWDAILSAEDIFGQGEHVNVGGADLAATVYANYKTLTTNSVLSGQEKGTANEAKYNEGIEKRLSLTDDYVDQRLRAITAIIQGCSVDEIKERNLADVLGYKEQDVVAKITREELLEKTDQEWTNSNPKNDGHTRCTSESHFYLKEEFRDGQDGWEYDLKKMEKRRKDLTPAKQREIGTLEKEIQEYQKNNASEELSPHDTMRTRRYGAIKYGGIMPVSPPVEEVRNYKKNT